MSDDRIPQYILAASKDKAIQDVGLYDDPRQVYTLGATIGVFLVLADWIESDKAKDARIERLKDNALKAINLMGGAVVERGSAVQMLTDMVDFFGDVTMGQIGVEKFEMGSKLIKRAKAVIKKADAALAHNVEFERIQTAAKRYEILRTLNPREFAELTAKNLQTGTPFDELVDEMARGESV
ncbi:MAG: hypothetical protein VXW65_05560 [Pseudomonadota bacterium]|nr:hypothetical protein [Pseudomonadota bacterium]